MGRRRQGDAWRGLPTTQTATVENLWGANYYSAHRFERIPSLVVSFDLVTMIR
jgi:hypothetical protein